MKREDRNRTIFSRCNAAYVKEQACNVSYVNSYRENRSKLYLTKR